MIKRIHPKIKEVPEYNPFKDKNVIDLGPNDNMTIKQALILAYNADLEDIIILGHCGCGCGLIRIVSSCMSNAEMLMLVEKLKMAVMDRELSDGHNPEEAG